MGVAMGQKDDIWEKRKRECQVAEDALARRDHLLSKVTKSDNEKTWEKACVEYLKANQWCDECDKRGYMVPANYVVHIAMPKDSQILFWDIRNWKGVCTHCQRRLVGTTPLKFLDPIPMDAQLYMVK